MGWTYATLVQAVQDFTEYSETSFVDNIDTFIQNCEERILYSVDLAVYRKNDTGTTTAGNPYLTVPSDFRAPLGMSVFVAGRRSFLLNKDVEYLQEYNPTGAQGTPKYYALFDVNNFLLSPTPNAALTVELHYWYSPESIVTAGTTWIGDNAEQALLYGTLFEAYTYMKGEPEILNLYNQRFAEALTRLKNFGEGREDTDAYRDGLVRIKAT
jgi:hypothetical protein